MIDITKSVVSEVKLYYRGATVTRKGRVSLNEGVNTVYFSGVSNSMESGSLRFRFPDGISIGNMNIMKKSVFFGREEEDELAEKRKDLETEAENIKYETEMWKSSIELIKQGNVSSAEDVGELITTAGANIRKLSAALKENEKKLKELTERADEKEKDMLIAELEVYCDTAGDYEFAMICQEENAGWTPEYELLVDTEAGKINLRLKGVVDQYTGEDWENVDLCMISGSKPRFMNKPELYPYYLNAVQNKAEKIYGSAPRMMAKMAGAAPAPEMNEMFTMDDSVLDLGMTGSRKSVVVEDDATGRQEFNVGEKVSVRNETEEKGIYIWSRAYDAAIEYLAVPLMSSDVYVLAKLKEDVNELVSGRCLLYVNGVYSGSVTINLDDFKNEIVLGIENRMFVRRVRTRRYRSTVPIKGSQKIEYEYEIKLENKKNTGALLTLVDRVPVSNDKDIGVKTEDISGADMDEDKHILKWKLDLAAGEKKTLVLKYTVTYPGSVSVNLPD